METNEIEIRNDITIISGVLLGFFSIRCNIFYKYGQSVTTHLSACSVRTQSSDAANQCSQNYNWH